MKSKVKNIISIGLVVLPVIVLIGVIVYNTLTFGANAFIAGY